MSEMFGFRIAPPTAPVSGTTVMARVVEGLAFRYYWATEELREEDFSFRPSPDIMSIVELQKHILDLCLMVKQCVFNDERRETHSLEEPDALRGQALDILSRVREQLLSMTDADLDACQVWKRDGKYYPSWHIMNGPLSDALTHVGQINAFRRINGNPTPAGASVFLGAPPRDRE